MMWLRRRSAKRTRATRASIPATATYPKRNCPAPSRCSTPSAASCPTGILPALARHDSLLVVAHGNSLRGIIKHLKGISDEAISEFNLPTAVPYVFEFDDGLNYVRDYFLGDPEEIAALMAAVADQGRK